MIHPIHWAACLTAVLLLASCGSQTAPSYFLSHHPQDTGSRPLRHYPVARQGNLTAWLTSDHVSPASDWLYAPGDPNPKHPIVGIIRAASMPEAATHDGSFLVVSGYGGPLFELWQGTEAQASLFTGEGGWVPVTIRQDEAVNSWVRVSPGRSIGGWSGFPIVIGDPENPEAIAGAMWYKSNTDPTLGGAASTRMLKRWLGRLKLADFATKR
jgi:hypothetical protein